MTSTTTSPLYKPTCKTFFSGAGGLDAGLVQAGVEVLQSLEIDPACCNTLRANFNHEVVEADITERTVLSNDKTDIIGLTFPCTKYSTIADIHGTRTGDSLFLHAFRHIALEKPEAFVVENVPGMKKFKVVMEAFCKIPDYYITVFCPMDAKNWLPQKRERLIVIGTRKNNYIAEPAPSNSRVLLRDIIDPNAPIDLPDYAIRRLNGAYRDKPIISDPSNKYELAPTCVAHYAKDVSTRMVKDIRSPHGARAYTVREYARLQGFPDSFQFAGSTCEQYRQIGNAVAVDMGRWIGDEMVKYFNRAAA